MSQVGRDASISREAWLGSNNVSVITAPGSAITVPFPDFAQGSTQAKTIGNSVYHGLQTKVEKRFGSGVNFLATYTWSKSLSDAVDLLNGGNTQGYRAPDVPGFGIGKDYALSNSDVRNVFHISGGYELPFGKGKKSMTSAGKAANILAGGWSVIWSGTLRAKRPCSFCRISAVTRMTMPEATGFSIIARRRAFPHHLDDGHRRRSP